jgi:hypothetical protein
MDEHFLWFVGIDASMADYQICLLDTADPLRTDGPTYGVLVSDSFSIGWQNTRHNQAKWQSPLRPHEER